MWPRILARVQGAKLVVMGRPSPGERLFPDRSITILGYVEDPTRIWADASVLVAPVAIGGGVRVKILEAAARGLPVVASPAGVGTIGEYLPVRALTQDEEQIEEVVRLLTDRPLFQAASSRLYEANRQLWLDGFVHRQIETWLTE